MNLDYSFYAFLLIFQMKLKQDYGDNKKRDPFLAKRIIKKFDDIAENPFHFEILSGDLHDARSAPVGTKYRIIL